VTSILRNHSLLFLLQRLIRDSKNSKDGSVPFILWMDRYASNALNITESTLGRVIFGFVALYTPYVVEWSLAFGILFVVIGTVTFIQIIIW
jgi:hypothetical protein